MIGTFSPCHTSKPNAPFHHTQLLQSRVPSYPQSIRTLQSPPLATRRTIHTTGPQGPKSGPQILHSRFPKKTAIFLSAVFLIWYFDIVRLEEEPDWQQRAFDSLGEVGALPAMFMQTKDALDHWIDFHVPDSSKMLQVPEFYQTLNDGFERLAFGWAMNEEDAEEVSMPVTHGVRFRINSPCEDYFALGTSPGPGEKLWNYWSVFDGHAGKGTSQYLHWNLIPQLSRSLCALPLLSPSHAIEDTIKQTFLRVDNDIMARAKHAGNWFPAASAAAIHALAPALAGSCALLAAFDPLTSKLRVACTGDSRAVLGRWDPHERKYTCHPLSVDQTGFNELEVARITAEHPGEPDIIDPKSGRLLGIAVTRAFGDHRWKWDNELIKQMQYKFWGSSPRPGNKTPPYMTAEPVVTETDVVCTDPKDASTKSDFMIMASDGLWDRISSEHAVQCVQMWLEAKARGNGSVTTDPLRKTPLYPERWQLDPGVTFDVEKEEEISWKATPEYFAFEDDNAAVCLAKNAMGGTRKGLLIGLLSVPGPQNRKAVDDTTIMVVFFDKVKYPEKMPWVQEQEKRWWWPWGGSS